MLILWERETTRIGKIKRNLKKRSKSKTTYFVYMLECQNGELYTGITTDVRRRLKEHRDGTGARYTRSHTVLGVVFVERHPTRSSALKREALIKSWRREQKLSFLGQARLSKYKTVF